MENTVLNHLETERQRLLKKRQLLLDDFNKAASGNWQKRLSQLFIKIQQTNNFLKSLEKIEADTHAAKAGGPRRYAVSSLFLHESFRKLTAPELLAEVAEGAVYVNGVRSKKGKKRVPA